MWSFPLFPDQASTVAGRVDNLYAFLCGITAFFTAMNCFLIVFFCVRYRRGSKAVDRSNPVDHNVKLEIFWVAVPFALVMVLFFWGAVVFFDQYNTPADASDIYVVGKQWMWKIQHPEGNREINELHVPVGRAVRLTMTSQDVIHSFFIPAFRIKQDVLPGRYTSMWFRATKTGRYHLFCAEYCGTNHSGMVGSVVVMEDADYQRWLQEGTTGVSMSSEGARLFRRYGCSGCHASGASVRAPLLEGVYNTAVPLQGGRVVTADDRYLRDSILRPKDEVVAGYDPVMPSFEGEIGEDDLLQIIAYIKSLAAGRREAER